MAANIPPRFTSYYRMSQRFIKKEFHEPCSLYREQHLEAWDGHVGAGKRVSIWRVRVDDAKRGGQYTNVITAVAPRVQPVRAAQSSPLRVAVSMVHSSAGRNVALKGGPRPSSATMLHDMTHYTAHERQPPPLPPTLVVTYHSDHPAVLPTFSPKKKLATLPPCPSLADEPIEAKNEFPHGSTSATVLTYAPVYSASKSVTENAHWRSFMPRNVSHRREPERNGSNPPRPFYQNPTAKLKTSQARDCGRGRATRRGRRIRPGELFMTLGDSATSSGNAALAGTHHRPDYGHWLNKAFSNSSFMIFRRAQTKKAIFRTKQDEVTAARLDDNDYDTITQHVFLDEIVATFRKLSSAPLFISLNHSPPLKEYFNELTKSYVQLIPLK
ncbi:hypothetical protein PR048_018477 [Dryococelus australis]|uniref:Uncharacterized protein n=1 Tax=Dryococelus australis TaxID=614101 RepID=A0ABQ9HCJ7_9NEOP|nr:hypothetical protein PR048_018477 [Dryococelus australis]